MEDRYGVTLDISQLLIKEIAFKDEGLTKYFYFKIDETSYEVLFIKEKETRQYRILTISHRSGVCSLCEKFAYGNKISESCLVLFANNKALLQRLLNEPSVRLRLLF